MQALYGIQHLRFEVLVEASFIIECAIPVSLVVLKAYQLAPLVGCLVVLVVDHCARLLPELLEVSANRVNVLLQLIQIVFGVPIQNLLVA